MPARARHCKWGTTSLYATVLQEREGAGKCRSTSQETCPGLLDQTLEVKRVEHIHVANNPSTRSLVGGFHFVGINELRG
jgi:hypothetical protein